MFPQPWMPLPRRAAAFVAVLVLALAGAVVVARPARGAREVRALSGPAAPATGPCDILQARGTPCVAAYSTVRALYAHYRGPLYRVTRASDLRTVAVPAVGPAGIADLAVQQRFCAGTTCTIYELVDQSPEHNNLLVAGPGSGVLTNDTPDVEASAAALPVMVAGHHAEGLLITPGVGYRDDGARGLAQDGRPEGMYMVTSSDDVGDGCCFDFGNGPRRNVDEGDGHLDAVNFSTRCEFRPCDGHGPWVQADLENGLFQSDRGYGVNPRDTGVHDAFVTAMLADNGRNHFTLAQGDARAGPLSTDWSGSLPTLPGDDYEPMQQQGAVLLGIGGDNSNRSSGRFYEGVITAGVPSGAADVAVQANIVAAGYGSGAGSGAAGGLSVPRSGRSPSIRGSR